MVEVGVDPSIKLKVQDLRKEIVENRKEIEKIHPVIVAMTQKMAQGVALKPEQLKTLQEMVQKEKELQEKVDSDMREFNNLQDMLNECSNARVEVTGEVFAGTKISISDVSMVVKNSMTYCRFVKEQGDIKMSSL